MKTIKFDAITGAHTFAALTGYIKTLESQLERAKGKQDKITELRLEAEIKGLRDVQESLNY